MTTLASCRKMVPSFISIVWVWVVSLHPIYGFRDTRLYIARALTDEISRETVAESIFSKSSTEISTFPSAPKHFICDEVLLTFMITWSGSIVPSITKATACVHRVIITVSALYLK